MILDHTTTLQLATATQCERREAARRHHLIAHAGDHRGTRHSLFRSPRAFLDDR